MVTAAEVGKYLEEVLRHPRKNTVTYTEVAEEFHLGAIGGVWSAHPLCQIFDELDREDASASRPFRTSAVISLAKNQPGDGFFTALREYKKLQFNNAQKESVWITELQAAQQYNW